MKLEQAARPSQQAVAAMQLALEALCVAVEPKRGRYYCMNEQPVDMVVKYTEAITALREALDPELWYCNKCGKNHCQCPPWIESNYKPVEQAEQEPVAWAYEYGTDRGDAVNEIRWYQNLTALDKPKPVESGSIRNVRPLYAAPVRTKDLTDDEIKEIWSFGNGAIYFARAVIAADREKNNGTA